MKTRLIVYPLAAFGAYAVGVLAIFRWWTRHAELDEQLDQMSETPAPAVRPELVELCRQMQAAMGRHFCEQIDHKWKADR